MFLSRTNDQVEFYLWDKKEKLTNYLQVGHFYYVDVRAPHAVTNNSDVDRIHLVMDVYVNRGIRELLELPTFGFTKKTVYLYIQSSWWTNYFDSS